MKKIIALFMFIMAGTAAFAQNKNPDHWTYSVDYGANGEATLLFNLKLDKDWHVYSQNTPDGGPLPMVFKFEQNACYDPIGKVTEPAPHVEFDSTFEVNVFIFEGEATFRQSLKTTNSDCMIKGTIEYQICKQACIARDTSFVFNMKKKK